VRKRKISNLDVNTRQAVIDSLQRMGQFTDQSRRDELLDRALADLEPRVLSGFGTFLARQATDGRRLCDVKVIDCRSVVEELKQNGTLSDPVRVKELDAKQLIDLDKPVANQLIEELMSQLRHDLATKTMEELPAETRDRVHEALDEQNYFVDREKVGWYERRTLAQLPSDLLRGLEHHLGSSEFEAMASTPFRELPAEQRNDLLAFLDSARLLSDRATRLRLTQTGNLGDLPDEAREPLFQHLGRQRLVQIRDKRPPALADHDREAVWVYLRAQGFFADEFKEELFAYQNLDEFGTEVYETVRSTLAARLRTMLESLRVGDMPPERQSQVRAWLDQADYFVDEARLRQVEEQPVQSLPEDLRQAVEGALGAFLLQGLDSLPVAQLHSETQAALWRYLDEIGYFVDEKKKSRILDHRLEDLASDSYERVVADLARSLEAEIDDRPVSELDDTLRQGLREALEANGHFESDETRIHVMAQPLGSFRREELDGLATQFGQVRLEAWSDRKLSDLPEAEQASVLAHLEANSWFLDQNGLDRLRSQPLGDLDTGTRQAVLDIVRHQQAERLRRRPIADLDRAQRRALHQILLRQGLALEENQMRPYRRQRLTDLDPEVYRALLQDLGEQVVTAWGTTKFQDLDRDQQALLSAYLGRRILGRIELRVLLYTISRLWIDYLTDIEDLRRGIGLEAYGQRDPLIEYKRRAFELFEELGQNIRRSVVRSLFRQPPEPLATS
jgi:hypothetical protein